VGAGFEWAFWNNWTIKFEYDYLGLNSRTFIIPVGAPFPQAFIGDTFTGNRNVQEVKVGFNYLFNWGGPARY
jgi:outer membrane immunogenic protein